MPVPNARLWNPWRNIGKKRGSANLTRVFAPARRDVGQSYVQYFCMFQIHAGSSRQGAEVRINSQLSNTCHALNVTSSHHEHRISVLVSHLPSPQFCCFRSTQYFADTTNSDGCSEMHVIPSQHLAGVIKENLSGWPALESTPCLPDW